ncbi:MAG: phytanoyl-CoA dioxygenase family protein [Acidobacteriota bacterium]|nr:phytanoyl-CoA dioxygenase family protein [Acidobacteriota bacterium]
MDRTFLSIDQLSFYRENGYLLLRGFKTADACDELRARMAQLLDGFDASEHRITFSTKEDQDAGREDYFFESSDKIRFFFEEDAFDSDGNLKQSKELSINKVGHALHDRDPVFDHFSRDPDLASVAEDLNIADPRLVESMYIFKQPKIGGTVRPHQDASYIFTKPHSTVGFWFALEDATKTNGCLWALPGGHEGPLQCRFDKEPGKNKGTLHFFDIPPWPQEGWVPLEAAKGDMIILHGHLPHKSEYNRSSTSRHAYALHLVDGRCKWLPENWLQRPEDDPARGF